MDTFWFFFTAPIGYNWLHRVTIEINNNFLRPYSKEEVVKALKHMSLTKSLGTDGYNVASFNTIGKLWEKISTILSFKFSIEVA